MISPSLTEIGAGVSVNEGRVYYVIDCALPTNNGEQAVGTLVASGPSAVPGAGVIFPVEVVTPNADGDVIHEVKAGQSLWQIAISYGTRIDEIKRLNNLYDNNIYPGNKLLIRESEVISANTPVEGTAVEVPASPANLPTMTAALVIQTTTATSIPIPVTASPDSMMGIAIGIIALALLAGGLFVRLGASKKIDS
jgi:LysM repeat protein